MQRHPLSWNFGPVEPPSSRTEGAVDAVWIDKCAEELHARMKIALCRARSACICKRRLLLVSHHWLGDEMH